MNRNQNDEKHIDAEINLRTNNLNVIHFRAVSKKIRGITIVSREKLYYDILRQRIRDITSQLEDRYGEVFPSDMKIALSIYYNSFAVCDARDQFSRRRGRIEAKRMWLDNHRGRMV